MMAENLLVRVYQALTMDYEEQSNYKLAKTAIQEERIGDTIRITNEQLTDLFIQGKYHGSQLLLVEAVLKAQLVAAGVSPEKFQELAQMYTVDCLQKSTHLLNEGAEMMIEEAVDSI
jgi:hypothetical protein